MRSILLRVCVCANAVMNFRPCWRGGLHIYASPVQMVCVCVYAMLPYWCVGMGSCSVSTVLRFRGVVFSVVHTVSCVSLTPHCQRMHSQTPTCVVVIAHVTRQEIDTETRRQLPCDARVGHCRAVRLSVPRPRADCTQATLHTVREVAIYDKCWH